MLGVACQSQARLSTSSAWPACPPSGIVSTVRSPHDFLRNQPMAVVVIALRV